METTQTNEQTTQRPRAKTGLPRTTMGAIRRRAQALATSRYERLVVELIDAVDGGRVRPEQIAEWTPTW